MLKKLLLAGGALAMLGVPVAADAQHYNRSYGTYGNGRHYYWDGHHYRDRGNNAVVDTIIGGLLGYAVGSMANRSYSYPNYGYNYPYAYGSNYYSYPNYNYSYPNYSYPYGYNNYYNPYRY